LNLVMELLSNGDIGAAVEPSRVSS
jgi:hypothetical protein